ncbi:hypothetical protein [Paracoccus spongiarum]|uniref:DUF3035 domain-containing protein n=1 Tax=Paracoccus spongiarum TaxID=3064387 RepID=A0ABT9JEG4_9RHOB|nr:hypothetical protein [Paracoccus sp. 2205BS29-5]MDP5308089.1 hypothetical protein [Paracoccus sp. 2205BS29-5]
MNALRRLAACLLLLSPAACATGQDTYPALLPTERILAEPRLPDHATDAADGPAAAEADSEARAAALRRRAEALRRPVIDAATRARMQSAAP